MFPFNLHFKFSNLSSPICTLEREILHEQKNQVIQKETSFSTCSWDYSSSWKLVVFLKPYTD